MCKIATCKKMLGTNQEHKYALPEHMQRFPVVDDTCWEIEQTLVLDFPGITGGPCH